MTYTISTEDPQLAIGPGSLLDSSQVGDRTEYHYQLEGPEKLNFSFHSGEFEVIKSEGSVDVLIYRLPTHDSNDQNIIEGIRDAIAYYEERLAPFPYSQFKVVEFSLLDGSHATLFGNLMPMSEIRFLDGSADDHDKIDLSYYIPAHEIGHLWWGNMCLPAKGAGARVLTESLTEYFTLQVYTQKFGERAGSQFLSKQRQRYLSGRSRDEVEAPLILAEKEDDHLTYGKGTLVFHALSRIWSRERMDQELRSFMEEKCRVEDYPTAEDLYEYFKKVLPANLIPWWRSKMTTNEVDRVSIRSARYDHALKTLLVELEQQNSNVPIAYTDIGLVDENDNIVETHRVALLPGINKFDLETSYDPAGVRIDPDLLLLEVDLEDNYMATIR